MKRISVCINLDTLALGSGWRLPLEKDPTYKLVDERLISRLENAGMKAVLFAVGRDLEFPGNRRFIEKWSRAGHKIGNHAYSHPLNLASLTKKEIEIEIEKTDEFIKRTTGKKPRRFNAPGWALSPVIDQVLWDLGYKVDYSPFPSWWIYPLLVKQWWSLRRRTEAESVWRRRDWWRPLVSRRESWRQGKLTKLPLPTVGWSRIPVWHTGWFIFGEKTFPRMLKQAIKGNPEFYYLMHPADVISREDIPTGFEDKVIFERLSTPIEEKIKYLGSALGLLL